MGEVSSNWISLADSFYDKVITWMIDVWMTRDKRVIIEDDKRMTQSLTISSWGMTPGNNP